jgi:hypothetical protein
MLKTLFIYALSTALLGCGHKCNLAVSSGTGSGSGSGLQQPQ